MMGGIRQNDRGISKKMGSVKQTMDVFQNDGILFLMSMPYIAVFLFALFFYLQKRKAQTA